MSLSCLRASDPNVSVVDVLYYQNRDHENLYEGSGAPPLCSSSPPPPPSGCMVCSNRSVLVVCSELQQDEELVMEGAGRHIAITASECPRLLSEVINKNADSSGDQQADWWLLLLVFLILFIVLVASYKLWKCRRQ